MLSIYTRECYSSVKENEIIHFSGKWAEKVTLNEITQIQKSDITYCLLLEAHSSKTSDESTHAAVTVEVGKSNRTIAGEQTGEQWRGE